jgi:hypothetical protein
VLGPVGHVGSRFAYLATARRQHASDATCARQLAWSGSLPPGLELTWLGTAGVRLAYQGTVVWIDPYVTRFSLRDLVGRRVVPPSETAILFLRGIATLELGARVGDAGN